jgi:hypothetical protein
MVAKLIAVNVGLPRNVAWNGRTIYTGVWKAPVDGPRMGTRIPALTRQNAGLSAVSFRLIPIQYRSLPADSFSGLYGRQESSPPSQSGACRTSEHQIGIALHASWELAVDQWPSLKALP